MLLRRMEMIIEEIAHIIAKDVFSFLAKIITEDIGPRTGGDHYDQVVPVDVIFIYYGRYLLLGLRQNTEEIFIRNLDVIKFLVSIFFAKPFEILLIIMNYNYMIEIAP